MASLRGYTKLWDGGTVGADDLSAVAYLIGPWVTIFVDNAGTNVHVFRVQVAPSTAAGLNEVDANTVWYDYQEKDLSASGEVSVASGENKAIDLSPFGPQLLRLLCVSGTDNEVTAVVTSFGPN